MDRCAAQGKTAVFNEGGGGLTASVDPVGKKIELKAQNNGTSRYCQ